MTDNEKTIARERDTLKGLVEHYESVLDAMQGHTFFCQDGEGVLRRWYAPKKIKANQSN